MRSKGFSLIEVMIVVAIVAILAAVAYPSYTSYVVSGNRADVKTELSNIESKLQQYRQINRTYVGFTLSMANSSAVYPSSSKHLYTISLPTNSLTANTFLLTATPNPSSQQKDDGILCLNEEGQKFWSKGATACALSATSTWD